MFGEFGFMEGIFNLGVDGWVSFLRSVEKVFYGRRRKNKL